MRDCYLIIVMNKKLLVGVICLACKCMCATDTKSYRDVVAEYREYLSNFLTTCGVTDMQQKSEVAECIAHMVVNRKNNTFNGVVCWKGAMRAIHWKNATSSGVDGEEMARFYRKNVIEIWRTHVEDEQTENEKEVFGFVIGMNPEIWRDTDENNKLVQELMESEF